MDKKKKPPTVCCHHQSFDDDAVQIKRTPSRTDHIYFDGNDDDCCDRFSSPCPLRLLRLNSSSSSDQGRNKKCPLSTGYYASSPVHDNPLHSAVKSIHRQWIKAKCIMQHNSTRLHHSPRTYTRLYYERGEERNVNLIEHSRWPREQEGSACPTPSLLLRLTTYRHHNV